MRHSTQKIVAAAGVIGFAAGAANAALVSIDRLESSLLAAASFSGGAGTSDGDDWTLDGVFNGFTSQLTAPDLGRQASAGSSQEALLSGDTVTAEGQAVGLGLSDGSSSFLSDSFSRLEIDFTIDGPTGFDLWYDISSADVGGFFGSAGWTLEFGGGVIASDSVSGDDDAEAVFSTMLMNAGQYTLTFEANSDISSPQGESLFATASGAFDFAVTIPAPGSMAMIGVAGLLVMPVRRRR